MTYHKEHRLTASFLFQKVALRDEHLPQHHEAILQALWNLVRAKTVALHYVRRVVSEIVVDFLERQIARPTGWVHGDTGIRLDIESGLGDTPSHRWKSPAR